MGYERMGHNPAHTVTWGFIMISTVFRYAAVLTVLSMVLSVDARGNDAVIQLPAPTFESDYSLEEAIFSRRSVRSYTADSVALEDLAQLLWACQGITSPRGYRAAPSAGALYPLEVYVVAERVKDLPQGLYHYQPGQDIGNHSIELIDPEVSLQDVANAALGQKCIQTSACSFIITGVVELTRKKYGERARQYVLLEAGHAGQNLCLQAQTLELGAVTVGAFHEEPLRRLLGVDHLPIYVLSVGIPDHGSR
ncbi:SagB/ThcOx family dehydrogenase [bacterium]|nr:SagB/ThcOx family dehydrogenase [bacterium]